MNATETIRNLPLSALRPSKRNVRTVPGSDEALDELKASIAAHGLLKNLVVRAAESESETIYDVIAGRRRLDAYRSLAEDGQMHPDVLIPCRILDDNADDTEISLAENTVRLAMHPVDQVAAFGRLADEGTPATTIARRFGISPRTVEQRLRLARVHPQVLEAARNDQLDIEHLSAFAATTDQGRQLELWNRVKDNDYAPHAGWIRREVTADYVLAGTDRARFVGLDAYRKAGGRIDHDLFSDEDDAGAILIDPEVLDRLAGDKLQQAAAALDTEGWKWTETHLAMDWNTLHQYGRISGVPLGPDEQQRAELERIDARLDEINTAIEQHEAEVDDPANVPDDHPAYALGDEREELESKRNRLCVQIDDRADFTPEQRACAGCMVTVKFGELEVHKGLVRAEDANKVPQPAAPEPSDGETPQTPAAAGGEGYVPNPAGYRPPIKHSTPEKMASQAVKAAGLTNSLAEELRLTRNAMVKAHLADDFEAAFDLAAYQMAVSVFDQKGGYGQKALSLTLNETSNFPLGSPEERKALEAASPGIELLARNRADLPLEWLQESDPGKRFVAFFELPPEDRRRLFTAAVAGAVNPQLSFDHEARPEIEATVARLEIPFAAIWRPSAEQFWSKMRKDEMLDIARRTLGTEWTEAHAKDKKHELAEAMGAAFGREGAAETLGLTPDARAAALSWTPAGFAPFDPARPPVENGPGNSNGNAGNGNASAGETETTTTGAPGARTATPAAGKNEPVEQRLNGKIIQYPSAAAADEPGEREKPDSAGEATAADDDNDDESFDRTPATTVPAFMRK